MDRRDLATDDGRPILDSTHQGPVILIFIPTFLCPAAILIVASILVRRNTGVRFSWSWNNPIAWDFTGLLCMLCLTVVWSIVVCLQVRVGLGAADRPQNLQSYEKYEYVSELIYVIAVMIWKCTNGLSNAQVFGLADPRKRAQYTYLTVVVGTSLFGVLIACAVQCSSPHRWAIRERGDARCIDRPAFWAATGSLDILSDLVLHSLLGITIMRSQMARSKKKTAIVIIILYLLTYISTAGIRLGFIMRQWRIPDFALAASFTALATFSQLIFPMTILCVGKLSKFLDLESYLSPAIGASRRGRNKASKNYYIDHFYGQHSADATGPVDSRRKTYGDSVEELPLRTISKNGESSDGGFGLSDAITVQRDVTISSEGA